MNIKAFIIVLVTGGLLLNACQKDIDIFIPDPGQINGPDTTWQNTITATMPVSILKNSLSEEPYLDSFTVNANIASVITPFGIRVNFPPNCCANSAGQPVTGKVQIEIKVVKKKGDMIRLSKPTTYNDSLLVTAGELFIQLKKDGQILQLAPSIRYNIQYVDLPVNAQNRLFVGDETNAERFNWLPNPDLLNNTINPATQGYEIYTNRLRWINIANAPSITTTASTAVTVDLANYFTNANTIAYTVFKDLRSVVAMNGDLNTRKFMTGKLPAGKQITVVVISRQGNDYYLGYESAVTVASSAGSPIQLVRVVPIKKSFPEIISYLSTL
jgi:hypothetical protein